MPRWAPGAFNNIFGYLDNSNSSILAKNLGMSGFEMEKKVPINIIFLHTRILVNLAPERPDRNEVLPMANKTPVRLRDPTS